MNTLPYEIVGYCLGFLTKQDELFARLVCSLWRDLIPKPDKYVRHLYVQKYLIDHGYLDLLLYLSEEIGYTKDLDRYVISSGNMDFIRYVDTLGIWNDRTTATIPKHNAIEIMKFLLEEKKLPIHNATLSNATQYDNIDLMEYLYSMGNFDDEKLYSALMSATNFNKYRMVEWLCGKGAKPDYESCIWAASDNSAKVLELYIENIPLSENEINKLMLRAIDMDSLQCIKVLEDYTDASSYPIEVRNQIHRRIKPHARGETIQYLYLWEYISYMDALRAASLKRKGGYKILSWLRGETKYCGPKLRPVPDWPDNAINIGTRCLCLLHWLRSPERIHGKCPWDERFITTCALDNKLDHIKWSKDWRIHKDDVCPWNSESMKMALNKSNIEIVVYMRNESIHGKDVCPWPIDMKVINVNSPEDKALLMNLECPISIKIVDLKPLDDLLLMRNVVWEN